MIGPLKIIDYRRLENPCTTCLVRPVCKHGCDNKFGYYEKRARYLRAIKYSVAPVCTSLCLAILAFLFIYHEYTKDETVPAIGLSIIAITFIGGAYLDIYYLDNKVNSADHELRNIDFERDYQVGP
jgi:hypothetical protein